MSLVAYDNSDISSEEEEDKEVQGPTLKSSTPVYVTQKKDATFETEVRDSRVIADEIDCPSFSNVLPKPKEHPSSFFEEDITRRLMFSSVPLPKKSSEIITSAGNKSDVSSKSRTLSTTTASKKTVKITLPSLSEFNDEDEESKPKKLKPSSKGSGLFALLPAPKNLVVKENNRQLIPRVISKPPPKISKPSNLRKKNRTEALINYPDSGEESGEETEGSDFFSLTHSTTEIVCPNPAPDISIDVSNVNHSENLLNESSTSSETPPLASTPIFPQRPSEHDVTALPEIPADSSEANILQLDEDAIHRLCGRRGREEIVDAQVIDVSGETHLPDPTEWLTKQLTEEQETRSHGHRKRDGPTTQQRRKHQITYLAFQAKERELELKNQWAQNKMSRKQTQAKYGF